MQWVAVYGDDVGEVPGRDTADPVVWADQFGCMDGGGLGRGERALAATDLVGELAGVGRITVRMEKVIGGRYHLSAAMVS